MSANKIQNLAARLQTNGFALLDNVTKSDFLNIAASLGRPYLHKESGHPFDIVKVRESRRDLPGAWSNIYKTGAFPFHTDFAAEKVPPRFLLLRCVSKNHAARKTGLIDMHNLSIDRATQTRLFHEPWVIRNGSFHMTTPLFDTKSRPGNLICRYDPVCMRPFFPSRRANEMLYRLFQKAPEKQIDWKHGRLLIIDNWRCVHRRNTKEEQDKRERVLVRILVHPSR